MKRIVPTLLILMAVLLPTSLTGCSSEDRQAITDKEAKKQTDRIRQTIDKARDAVRQLEKHNEQLPD
ncbi:MAG: hypothetical protein PF442_02090 [Desulfobulbaceae bacterium]|jgi:hypothetical protein|nr:hypothetical protein [Desulfobulbaceae bacterium]